jgi:hypothetical protein
MDALWTAGLLVVFTSNIGYAQTDEWSAIVCNKNNTNNTIALQMKSIGACSPASSAAAKVAALQNNKIINQQIANNVGSVVGGLVSLFGQSDNNVAPAQPDQATLRAAQAAQIVLRQQQLNASAADTLAQANSLMASLNGGTSGSAVAPDATAALNSLLDTQPSNDSTVAIGALLGDSGQGAASSDPVATISGLLTPPAPSMPRNLTPQDSEFNTALEDSTDPTSISPFQSQSLTRMLQSGAQKFTDGLNGLVSSGRSLISNLTADPIVQWVAADKGSLTTMPLPAAGDDADMAANKVFGQSIVGFGDLFKGMASVTAWPKALYSYGTKMVNQMGADIGLANDSAFEIGASSP